MIWYFSEILTSINAAIVMIQGRGEHVLRRLLKRLVPLEWKVRLHSNKTVPKDIVVRPWNRLRGGIPITPGKFIYLVTGHRRAARFLRKGRIISETIPRGTYKKWHRDRTTQCHFRFRLWRRKNYATLGVTATSRFTWDGLQPRTGGLVPGQFKVRQVPG